MKRSIFKVSIGRITQGQIACTKIVISMRYSLLLVAEYRNYRLVFSINKLSVILLVNSILN